jgi:hypothetical protein
MIAEQKLPDLFEVWAACPNQINTKDSDPTLRAFDTQRAERSEFVLS